MSEGNLREERLSADEGDIGEAGLVWREVKIESEFLIQRDGWSSRFCTLERMSNRRMGEVRSSIRKLRSKVSYRTKQFAEVNLFCGVSQSVASYRRRLNYICTTHGHPLPNKQFLGSQHWSWAGIVTIARYDTTWKGQQRQTMLAGRAIRKK